MEITTQESGDLIELRVRGMLDNNWAEHLTSAINEAIRQGGHRLVVNLLGVTYLSSAGIAVLVKAHQQLRGIHGFFGVCDPSPAARQVLRLTGLEKMLICDLSVVASGTGRTTTIQPNFRLLDRDGTTFELYDLQPGAVLRCRAIGNPRLLSTGGFAPSHCKPLPFADGTFGLGVGAFGSGYDDCRSRFGEFLAVAGTAAHLPTHGRSAPDYQLATGDFVPEVQSLYALALQGPLAKYARFERDEAVGAVPLSHLVDHCLELADAERVGMVIIAESAGLVGAALRRSPAGESQADIFRHPEIRKWLSYSTDRTFKRSLALIVGVATRGAATDASEAALAPFVRPMSAAGGVRGHFHAGTFSFRPLKKGRLDLKTTVASLFELQELQGVLHLLADRRDITGAGESEFVRGAIWFGPIPKVDGES